jgi:hypothetical protein
VVGTNPILSVFQRRKLRALIRYHMDHRPISKLGGHRDVVSTECPGNRIYRWIKKWRSDFGLTKPTPRSTS